MVKIILTLILILLFLFSGKIILALKKFISLFTTYLLKIINVFEIKIAKKEKSINVSKQFKDTYKEIKVVKISKKNIKQISSINWLYFIIFIISALLIILNLNIISRNIISNWLFEVFKDLKVIKNVIDMNTIFTATLFSTLSFSVSKLLQRWKETKQQRLQIKKDKLKVEAIKLMDSKELLDNAKMKDEEKYKELK